MFGMRRRDFISLLGVTAVGWPLTVRAQQPERVRRVGVLMSGNEVTPEQQARLAAFRAGLQKLGWTDGANVQLHVRWGAGNSDNQRASAAELVGLLPDVILTATTGNLASVLRATSTIPVVFVQVSDPLAQGFVQSLARPGGNITGFSAFEFSIGGKWLDLLKQMSSGLARVAVLMSPPEVDPQSKFWLRSVEAEAPSLGVEVMTHHLSTASNLESAMERLSRQPNIGLIWPTGTFVTTHAKRIVDLARRYRLPAIYPSREFVTNGGLMYYGYDSREIFRQASFYVDRILKGGNPGDLPIQSPTKFVFHINLTAAKALGIEVPVGLMLRADELIE
jgi:putative tryptophan/tyrosine transport system substrate-binding protein